MGTFFEDFGKKISETAETVSAKAGEAMEIQKLKVQKRALEQGNEEDLAEIGRIIYEQYKAGESVNDEMCAFCEAVERREKIIAEFAEKLRVLRGDRTCASCGSMVSRDMAYCPYCGEKKEHVDKTNIKEKSEKVMEKAGKFTEKAGEFAEKAADKVKEAAENVKEKMEKQASAVKDKASNVKEKTADMAEAAKEKATDMAAEAKEKATDIAAEVKEKATDMAEAAKEKVSDAADKTAEVVEETGEKAADKIRDLF